MTFDTGKAIYLQIAETLEEDIRRNFEEGDALPSEERLAIRFGVNRHTLRRAVDELIDAGIVERRRGLGIFVVNSGIEYRIHKNSRFTQALTDHGHSAETKILKKQLLPAQRQVALHLGIDEGDELVFVETLRTVDHRPFCVISHFLPMPRYSQVHTGYSSGSLHAFIEKYFEIGLTRSFSLISSLLPRGDDARLLAVGKNQPVLRVKSVNVDVANGTPVEYAITRFRGDRVELSVDLRS